MTTAEAAQILQLAGDATPAQIEARFRELRAMLEEKIAKALTPGLQAKYRSSFAEITTAFETLILSADTAALPGLTSAPTAMANPSRLPPLPAQVPAPSLPPLPTSSPRSSLPPLAMQVLVQAVPPAPVTPAKKSGGKSLLLGVIAAVIVLAAGGWLFMKIQADNAEKARLEVEAKQRADSVAQQEKARITAAEKAGRDKKDKELAALRARVAEIHASYDSAQRSQLASERALAEMKIKQDELAAAGKGSASPEWRALATQLQAQERYLAWFKDNLPGHPAKAARSQVMEVLTSRSIDSATPLVEAYAKTVRQLQNDIGRARDELLVLTGKLRVNSEPAGVNFTLTDVYGRTSEGRTPADLPEVPLGNTTITFKRDGWPEKMQAVTVARTETAIASANLTGGALSVTSTPSGLDFVLTGPGRTERGRTPATLADVAPGDYTAIFQREGWVELKSNVTVKAGQAASLPGVFPAPGSVKVTSNPTGAEIWRHGTKLGVTPLTVPEVGPGKVELEFKLDRYITAQFSGILQPAGLLEISGTLQHEKLTKQEAIADFVQRADGVWKKGIFGGSIRLRFKLGRPLMETNITMVPKYAYDIIDFDPDTSNLTLQYGDQTHKVGVIKIENGKLNWVGSGLWSGWSGTYNRVPDSAW